MSKVYDLTNKLSTEKPVIKIGDQEYKVKNGYKTVLLVQQKLGELDEAEAMDFVLEKLLGQKAKEEIDEMDLSFSDMKTIFLATMAASSGEELETIEARFQQATDVQG